MSVFSDIKTLLLTDYQYLIRLFRLSKILVWYQVGPSIALRNPAWLLEPKAP